MKIYGFYYGVDSFGADVAPAFEEGFYTDLDLACQKCAELNKETFEKQSKEDVERYKSYIIPEKLKKMLDEDPPIEFFTVASSELIK